MRALSSGASIAAISHCQNMHRARRRGNKEVRGAGFPGRGEREVREGGRHRAGLEGVREDGLRELLAVYVDLQGARHMADREASSVVQATLEL